VVRSAYLGLRESLQGSNHHCLMQPRNRRSLEKTGAQRVTTIWILGDSLHAAGVKSLLLDGRSWEKVQTQLGTRAEAQMWLDRATRRHSPVSLILVNLERFLAAPKLLKSHPLHPSLITMLSLRALARSAPRATSLFTARTAYRQVLPPHALRFSPATSLSRAAPRLAAAFSMSSARSQGMSSNQMAFAHWSNVSM
jgi:hypothetical protein